MATLSNNTIEICIQVDLRTLVLDAAAVAHELCRVLRLRYGTQVIGTTIMFPPSDRDVVVTRGAVFDPSRSRFVRVALNVRRAGEGTPNDVASTEIPTGLLGRRPTACRPERVGRQRAYDDHGAESDISVPLREVDRDG